MTRLTWRRLPQTMPSPSLLPSKARDPTLWQMDPGFNCWNKKGMKPLREATKVIGMTRKVMPYLPVANTRQNLSQLKWMWVALVLPCFALPKEAWWLTQWFSWIQRCLLLCCHLCALMWQKVPPPGLTKWVANSLARPRNEHLTGWNVCWSGKNSLAIVCCLSLQNQGFVCQNLPGPGLHVSWLFLLAQSESGSMGSMTSMTESQCSV